jgi:hypothetical protein
VTVTKVHSSKAQFKVRLSRLRLDPGDEDLLHCFMRLDVQVGEGDRGKEGFAEMTLEAWGPDAGPGAGGNGGGTSQPTRPGGHTTDFPNAPIEP